MEPVGSDSRWVRQKQSGDWLQSHCLRGQCAGAARDSLRMGKSVALLGLIGGASWTPGSHSVPLLSPRAQLTTNTSTCLQTPLTSGPWMAISGLNQHPLAGTGPHPLRSALLRTSLGCKSTPMLPVPEPAPCCCSSSSLHLPISVLPGNTPHPLLLLPGYHLGSQTSLQGSRKIFAFKSADSFGDQVVSLFWNLVFFLCDFIICLFK